MLNEKRNAPEIRFPGFTDDWEQRKLEETTISITDGSHYSPVTLKQGLPMLSVMNMTQDGFQCDKCKLISEKDFEDLVRNGCMPKVGDVLVAKDGATMLQYAFRVREELNAVVLSSIAIIRPKKEYDSEFIVQTFKNPALRDRIIRENTTGTGIPRIVLSNLRRVVISMPKLEEQKKLGQFFENLDNTIALHQRKLEAMKVYKKAMLQKMFPKDGENVPEVRFPEFTDDWEQRKFSELYVKVSEKNDLTFGTDKIISVANMYFKEDTKESSDDYMKTYNVMRLGDIAFEGNKSKNFAHGRFVENTIGDGIVSHVFDVFRPITEYDLSYWKYFINNEGVMSRTMARCTKSSTMMTNLVANDFLKESVLVPTLAEQKKIGEYFTNLDNLITLHQRKCDELKELKKCMLQKMFV